MGRGKGHQGRCIKDIWTKPKWGSIKGGRLECVGQGESGEGKMETKTRQWYLKSNKKWKRKKSLSLALGDVLGNMFSHSVGCLFILLMIYFAVE